MDLLESQGLRSLLIESRLRFDRTVLSYQTPVISLLFAMNLALSVISLVCQIPPTLAERCEHVGWPSHCQCLVFGRQ